MVQSLTHTSKNLRETRFLSYHSLISLLNWEKFSAFYQFSLKKLSLLSWIQNDEWKLIKNLENCNFPKTLVLQINYWNFLCPKKLKIDNLLIFPIHSCFLFPIFRSKMPLINKQTLIKLKLKNAQPSHHTKKLFTFPPNMTNRFFSWQQTLITFLNE